MVVCFVDWLSIGSNLWPKFKSGSSIVYINPDGKVYGANMGPPGSCRPQMGPCWPHIPCYQGGSFTRRIVLLRSSHGQKVTSKHPEKRWLFVDKLIMNWLVDDEWCNINDIIWRIEGILQFDGHFIKKIFVKHLTLNTLRWSDACMRQWITHHWFRWWLAKWSAPSHYLNQWWNTIYWTLKNKFQWNINRNSFIFIQEDAFENVVCVMATTFSYRVKFFRGKINIYLHFVSYHHIDTTQVVEILPQIRQEPTILYSQYHGCWCPGDVRSQGINSHDIDLVKPR